MSERRRLLRQISTELPVRTSGRVLVGIDGVDGSGKTHFAAALAAELRRQGRSVVVLHADDFLNPRAVRHRLGRASPEGFFLDSYDYDALEREVLVPLGPGGDGRYRPASLDLERDVRITPEVRVVDERAVAILEGLFLHRDRLESRWDYSVFLDAPFPVTVQRVSGRDGTVADPHHTDLRRYVEGQRVYFRSCNPWLRADRVVDNSDLDRPRILSKEEVSSLSFERLGAQAASGSGRSDACTTTSEDTARVRQT